MSKFTPAEKADQAGWLIFALACLAIAAGFVR